MSKKKDEVFWVPPLFDEDGVQCSAGINSKGQEVGDPVPMAPPVDYRPPPDIMTMIRTMIHSERMREIADAEGFDSPEEADDFDLDDDPELALTPYERHFLPPDERPLPAVASRGDGEGGEVAPASPPAAVSPPQPQSGVASSGSRPDQSTPHPAGGPPSPRQA